MNKIDISSWREYKVGDLFPVIIKPSVIHSKSVVESNSGIPYVVRSKFNNGIRCRVEKRADYKPSPAGTISFGAENASFFYQTEEFISGRDIYYLDTRNLSKHACFFLITCLQSLTHKYSYNYGLFPDLLKKEHIRLPATVDGKPDWQYMEQFISNKEKQIAQWLDILQNVNYLQRRIDNQYWRKYMIGDLFIIKKGKRLTKTDMREGNINFIGASAVNNGVTAKIANNEYLHPPNTITVNYNGSVGVSFYQDEPFWASDDVNVLYPLFPLNKNIAMFLIPIIQSKGRQYAFVDKWKKEYMEKESLRLPACADGKPDWQYMERFIINRNRNIKQWLDTMNIC